MLSGHCSSNSLNGICALSPSIELMAYTVLLIPPLSNELGSW